MRELSFLLSYSPDTGILQWKVAAGRWGRIPAGTVAGTVTSSDGYHHVLANGRRYKTHRLAWFLHHGEWPPHEIDHINGDPSDNRLVNLRLATRSENGRNTRRLCNATGLKGVKKMRGKFQARIRFDGRVLHLGTFDTAVEAHAAYAEAAAKYHGEFARVQ